jgi:hypothetical protein
MNGEACRGEGDVTDEVAAGGGHSSSVLFRDLNIGFSPIFMKMIKSGILFVTVALLTACHKTGSSPTQLPTTPTLQGTWSFYKLIFANFDTAGGMTHIPNDTVYPPQPEVRIFTKDSVIDGWWENFYYVFGHPDTFYIQQTNEWFDTSAYIATAAYYFETTYPTDTISILELTDSTLVTMEKIYPKNVRSGPVLDNIYTYGRKQ